MKRFIIFILFFISANAAFAFNEVSFIYLNGSNTNSEKSKEDFIKGVHKLHEQIIYRFEADPFIKNGFLKNRTIKREPIDFYWGDMSKTEIEVLDEDFNFLKKLSPKPAGQVRKFIAMCLHDAIWVSKPENMYPLVQKLHKVVMEEYKSGNPAIFMGYSAGTFIAHQYLLIKSPIVNLLEVIPNSEEYKEYREYVSKKDIKNTCTDAIFSSAIATYGIGKVFVFEDDIESFKKKVDGLNEVTTELCAPKEAIIGGINFASPYVLFYSELFDKNRPLSKLTSMEYKYIVENNIFWLTVNYADDPLGFPVSRNAKIDEVEKITQQKITPMGGFVYDKSDKKSGRTFIMAHLSYFSTAKKYARILTSAIKEGYKYFYMTGSK